MTNPRAVWIESVNVVDPVAGIEARVRCQARSDECHRHRALVTSHWVVEYLPRISVGVAKELARYRILIASIKDSVLEWYE